MLIFFDFQGYMGSELYEFIIKTKYNYTQKECFNLCLQNIIMDLCNCYDLNYDRLKDNVSPCLSEEQLKCTNDEYLKFIKESKLKCVKDCPLECDETIYNHALSIPDYPTENAYQKLKRDQHFSRFYNLTFEKFEERSLMVNIFYSKLSYLSVSQIKKVDFMGLLEHIGGLIGFFIGMSLLSFIEFIEIIIDVILILVSKNEN
jgi:hypothetical protein